MNAHGWVTTTLILLPLGGALLVWLLPMPRVWLAPPTLLISLFEIGFWIEALVSLRLRQGRTTGSRRS